MKPSSRIASFLFGFFFFLYALTMSGHFFSQDGEILYRAAVSFYESHGGAIDPLHGRSEIVGKDGQVYRLPVQAWGTRTGTDGKEYPQYGVGQPLLAVPLVAAGRTVAGILPSSLRRSFQHVYTPFQYHSWSWSDFSQRCMVGRFNQVISAVAVAVLYLFLFRLWGNHLTAVVVAALYGACTAAWVQSRTFFTEPLAGLCILLSFFLAERCRTMMADHQDPDSFSRGLRRAGWAGVAFGYGVLTRPDSILFLPGLALLLSYPSQSGPESQGWFERFRHSLRNRETWLRLLWFAIPALLFVSIIAWMNFQRFGGVFATGYADQPEGVRFRLPFDGIAGFLFSPGKSIFIYSPPVLLALFGWTRFLRRQPRLAVSVSIGVVLFFLFEASWQNWEGGWCWGPRHIFQITALLMLGAGPLFLASTVQWTAIRNLAVGILLALGLLVQLIGVSADFVKAIHLLPPNEIPLTIHNPAYSHPVLHLRMLLRGDHDLFFLHFLRANPPGYWLLPALFMVGLLTCGFLLMRELRDARGEELG